MTTSTDRQQYREVLASLVQKTQARFPDLNGRLAKATRLALMQDVELHADGTATVHSASDPTRHYRIVEGTCTNLDTVSFTYMRSAADCVLTTSQSVPSCSSQ
jgi:hypothetical protein